MVKFLKTTTIDEKKLIGKSLTMSYANNLTVPLWQNFMLLSSEVQNKINNEFISMQVYPKCFFDKVNLQLEFEKWATVEVSTQDYIPNEMNKFTIPSGEYAVFLHIGGINEAPNTFIYIFMEWLPNSGYELDFRPHFESLGEKYKRDSPESEEEIWIPIIKINN